MTEQPSHQRPHRHVSYRSLVASILLVAAIVVWSILLYAIFEFSGAVGQFLRIIMELAGSAGGN